MSVVKLVIWSVALFALFVLLSPGVLLTIPHAEGKSIVTVGEAHWTPVIVHGLIFALIYAAVKAIMMRTSKKKSKVSKKVSKVKKSIKSKKDKLVKKAKELAKK
jgi:hypothetical protein